MKSINIAAAIALAATIAFGTALDGQPTEDQAAADTAALVDDAHENEMAIIVRINSERRCREIGGQLFEITDGTMRCIRQD